MSREKSRHKELPTRAKKKTQSFPTTFKPGRAPPRHCPKKKGRRLRAEQNLVGPSNKPGGKGQVEGPLLGTSSTKGGGGREKKEKIRKSLRNYLIRGNPTVRCPL